MSAPQTSVATSMAIGVPGQIADLHTDEVGAISSRISTEASLSIPFGVLVAEDGADGAKLFSNVAYTPAGIMLFEKVYDYPSERDDFGPLPGLPIQVLKGETSKVLVYLEESVSAGDTVRIRHATEDRTASPPQVLGGFRTTSVSAKTSVLGGCRFVSDGTAGDIAELEITGPITIASSDS